MTTQEETKIIEQKCEEAHQKLLSINQEQYRATQFLHGEEQKVSALQAIKITLEESTDKLTEEEKALKDEIENLKSIKAQITSESDEAQKALQQFNKEKEKGIYELNDKKIAHELKEAELVSRETSVSERESKVTESEILLADKHAKIKAFAGTI